MNDFVIYAGNNFHLVKWVREKDGLMYQKCTGCHKKTGGVTDRNMLPYEISICWQKDGCCTFNPPKTVKIVKNE